MEHLEGRTLFAGYDAATVSELIDAIGWANASPVADTITLAAGTTFTLSRANNFTDGANGLPVVTANGGGLTIVGNGSTIERSRATGTPSFRLFDVAAGASLALNGLTVRGGLAYEYASPLPPSRGGGILSLGSLSLAGVTVSGNVAWGATPNWSFETVSGRGQGGGVYSAGSLTIADSLIRDNVAAGGEGASYARINGTSFPPGPGADGLGGGIYVAGGAAAIRGSLVTSNTARGGFGGRRGGSTLAGGNGYGGGLCAAAGAVTVRDTTVTANAAVGGGGLVWQRDALVPGNEGSGIGGGVYILKAAKVGLDAFSALNLTGNTATSGSRDLFGRYTKIL